MVGPDPDRVDRPPMGEGTAAPLLDTAGLAEYRALGFANGGLLLDDAVADELFGVIHRIVTDGSDPLHSDLYDMGLDGRALLHRKNLWMDAPAVRKVVQSQEIARTLHDITGGTRFHLWQDGFFY